MTNPKDSAARTKVGPHNTIGVVMEDLPEAERRALEKELEEEMAEARRRKLACFQKTRTEVIKKTVPAIMTTATATHTVIPNLTPEELVKFIDIAVACKYGNDLTNFTRTITEEVHSTLDTFKTDLKTRCLHKLDRLCNRFMVSHGVNNRILNLAHLTRVAHLH
jgi:predicted GNAT family acetyltransferase